MTMIETWEVRKSPVLSSNGVVVTQHYGASQIGAQVLADGGNAVDAAIAASFAVGVLEPWQSGVGSIGHMVIFAAAENKAYAIDFSARTPQRLNLADYALTGTAGRSIFGWPQVVDDRNIEGPYSFGVPGQVAGTWLAHGKFGRLPWARLVEPAAERAEAGLQVDWYTTLKIASASRELTRYKDSAAIYLPGGWPPSGTWLGATQRVQLPNLAKTLRRIAEAGGDDFYLGDLAEVIAADAEAVGSSLTLDDLRGYRATLTEIVGVSYRDATVFAVPGLTAGPSLLQALQHFADRNPCADELRSDSALFPSIAEALFYSYEQRLANMGSAPPAAKTSCTSHISVVDAQGNAVSLTQTLLDLFGSRVTLPRSGILMNNALMWFDPQPGMPNSIGPGRIPLSNMCPVVARVNSDMTFALGASGGRRIFPSVMQLLVFLIDRRMTLDQAIHFPRIDVSGDPWITADSRIAGATLDALRREYDVHIQYNGMFPSFFACPNIAARDERRHISTGAAFVDSPCAAAAAG